MTKIRFKCPWCDSTDISRDASAYWNEEIQEWEVSDLYDDYSCGKCGLETKYPEEEEINPTEED